MATCVHLEGVLQDNGCLLLFSICFFFLLLLGNVFQGVCIHIVPAGIGNARCDIFQQQIMQNGGQVEAAYGPSCTHVVVDESVDRERALRLLKMETFPPAVQMVKCTWLSACISERKLLSTEDYRLLSCDRYF